MKSQRTRPAESIQSLRCGAYTLVPGPIPLIMGVVNVTPDSFSDGGKFHDVHAAVAQAHDLARAGAAIVDIGGESTRPGADTVTTAEELDRVMPVCKALINGNDTYPPIGVPVSVDTKKAPVAEAVLQAGAHMINDVSAAGDREMAKVLREAGDSVAVVLMHMKGTPKTMQTAPRYDDVTTEVVDYLTERAEMLIASGVARERIVLDPGIGFGKRLHDNLNLLNNIDALRSTGFPIMIGASRKTFIGKLLDADPEERLTGSLAVAAHCFENGADFVRVHDVKETNELFRVLDAIRHPDHVEDK
jgi:dihydropteroate synthase